MEKKKEVAEASRRDFLNRSVLAAGAGALAAAKGATAATTSADPKTTHVADVFTKALSTPAKPAAFPMHGAEVFADIVETDGEAHRGCPFMRSF